MKRLFFVLLAFVPAFIVSCASCNTKQPTAEVVLRGNSTTGYSWICIPDNSGIYEIIEEDYVPDYSDKQIVGSGGQYKAVLQSVKQGKGFVKFVYKRSWENKPIDEKTYTVNVDEKLNITVL